MYELQDKPPTTGTALNKSNYLFPSSTLNMQNSFMKKQTIRNFIQRQESHFKEKMDMSTACEEAKEEAFAERFMKFKARKY